MIRLVLIVNWFAFAVASNMAIHGHGSLSRGVFAKMAREDMAAENPVWADDPESWREEYRRADIHQARAEAVQRSGQIGWWVAWGATLFTAVGLMIGFPRPDKPTWKRGS